jgi:hypothetical protein
VADVFVSYKKEDRALAERLVMALRAAGKSVWWDDALDPTQAWDAIIEREIAAARHVIVLWTPRSVASDWVRSEALYAQDHGKLVPVIGEACDLPLAFVLRQAVDLSSGKCDDTNPQWVKLVGWLSGDAVGGTADDRAAALAATPVKALTGERWLGPARRPALALGALAAVVLAGAAAVGLWSLVGRKPPQPAVVIDPLVLTNAKELPASFAKDVSDEMFANFSSSSRISPVVGDGKRRPNAYQLTGDVVTEGDKVAIFSKLYAPNLDAPVMTLKLEQPSSEKNLPFLFGMQLARLTRCVATASDSTGSKLTTLPPAAFGPWSRFCQQSELGPGTPAAASANLRLVVAEAPKFANGWSNLAETLYVSSGAPGADRAGLQAEALKAADRALALDPTTAKAVVVKSWGVLGHRAPPKDGSDVARLHDFPAWEALALKSVRMRPSDCGCELHQYADMLAALGRPSAALPLADQAVANDPVDPGGVTSRIRHLGEAGHVNDAEKAQSELEEKMPNARIVRITRMNLDIWRGDWSRSGRNLDLVVGDRERAALPQLIDALSHKDAAAARSAAAPLLQMIAQRERVGPIGIAAVAAAGYDDEAAQAFETLVAKDSVMSLQNAFAPPFAAMRKTPRFAALVEKLGLMDYWRMTGRRPDFCNEPDPAALCASVSKS